MSYNINISKLGQDDKYKTLLQINDIDNGMDVYGLLKQFIPEPTYRITITINQVITSVITSTKIEHHATNKDTRLFVHSPLHDWIHSFGNAGRLYNTKAAKLSRKSKKVPRKKIRISKRNSSKHLSSKKKRLD